MNAGQSPYGSYDIRVYVHLVATTYRVMRSCAVLHHLTITDSLLELDVCVCVYADENLVECSQRLSTGK